MLFIDYSAAFNTIVPSKLIIKMEALGLHTAFCNWVLDFLTGRTQVMKVENNISTSVTLNTGAPPGCVLSPLLYSLFSHDCMAMKRLQLNHQVCRRHNSSNLSFCNFY